MNPSLLSDCSPSQPEALTALLADDNRFGFIVMDGNGALFGTLQVGPRFYDSERDYRSLWTSHCCILQGNTRDVLHKFTVDLPKKHGMLYFEFDEEQLSSSIAIEFGEKSFKTWSNPGRGGQSALRFARLRMEKRHNYVRKVDDYIEYI